MAYGIDINIELELTLNNTYLLVVGSAEYDVYIGEGIDLVGIDVDLYDDNGDLVGHFHKHEGELFDAVREDLAKGSYIADKIAEARL